MATPRDVAAFIKIIDPRGFKPRMFMLNFFAYTDVALQQVFVDLVLAACEVAPHILSECENQQQQALLETLIKMKHGLDDI